MKQVFVINPIAGKGHFQQEVEAKIKALCTSEKIDWEIYKTKSIGDAERFIKNYPGKDKVRFFAIGGDGTLHEVINGAMARGNTEVGLFPCGSGNDFVRIFSDPNKFLDIKGQIQGVPHPIDLIKTRQRYAINMCNMGVDAETAAQVHRYTKFMPGTMAYSASLLNRFFHKLGFEIKVTLDNGEVISGLYILSTFANGVAYGGGYYSAPKARYDDGLMDICLVKPVSRLKIAQLLAVYKNGGHLEDQRFKEFLIYRRSSRASIETPELQNFCADGEIIPLKNVEMEICPKVLDFVLPQGVYSNEAMAK